MWSFRYNFIVSKYHNSTEMTLNPQSFTPLRKIANCSEIIITFCFLKLAKSLKSNYIWQVSRVHDMKCNVSLFMEVLVTCEVQQRWQKPHPWHWVILILSLMVWLLHQHPCLDKNITHIKSCHLLTGVFHFWKYLLQIHLIISSHLWISPLKTSQDLPSSYQVHTVHFSVPLSCEVVLHLLQLYIYPGFSQPQPMPAVAQCL